ncbi:MAG: hypothetical protein K2X91_11345 [Thermoleophilia bacterium]|nr:hypothetical protein [Thermoleophilia bacterium]
MLRRAASTLSPLLLAAFALAPLALAPRADAGNDFPRGEAAVGYGPGALADPGPGCPGCRAWPYCTSSCVYGYQDFTYGRGPLINLGGASLQPGFRGYGALGSIGYGQGMYPATWVTQEKPWGWWLKPSA